MFSRRVPARPAPKTKRAQ